MVAPKPLLAGTALLALACLTACASPNQNIGLMAGVDTLQVGPAGVAPQIAAAEAVPQPVTQSPLPPPAVTDRQAQRTANEQGVAELWPTAQAILNGPDTAVKHNLYVMLCNSGDQSACFIAAAR